MISSAHPFASWFLVVSTSFFLVVIALPLLLAPLTWARRFGWRPPEGNTDLTVYFGRCLGALALAVIVVAARAIPAPGSHLLVFELIALATGLMVVVHVWGWLRRAQPLSETLEIPVWAVVCALSAWLRWSQLG